MTKQSPRRRRATLVQERPDLAAEWDPVRNDRSPTEVTAGSGYRAWWRCSRNPDHVWVAAVRNRVTGGTGCPQCSGKKVSAENKLAARFPDIAREWHPTKNDRTPSEVTSGSGYRAWWKCSGDPTHVWLTTVDARTADNSACPYCSGRLPSPSSSLATQHPAIAKQWDHDRNRPLTPDQVRPGSSKRVWWRCPKGPDHVWSTSIANRTGLGTGCPACAGRQASVTNSLATRRPDLASQWHPTLNGKLTPADVPAGSNKKAWWKCPEGTDHEWTTKVETRAIAGNGCPFCSGRQPSVTNNLIVRHPDLAAEWHPTLNGKLTPTDVPAGSNKRVWWKCTKGNDHEWLAPVVRRTGDQESGCPFCAGKKVSTTNSLATVAPEVAAEWHPDKNRPLTPNDVVAGATRKVWWRCAVDPRHEWVATLNSRCNVTSGGSGCPQCAKDGFNPALPGIVYLMRGPDWAKVGITNDLALRTRILRRSGVYRSVEFAVQFPSGQDARDLERTLLLFIRPLSGKRAPANTDGYTESFPASLAAKVLREIRRRLKTMPDAKVLLPSDIGRA